MQSLNIKNENFWSNGLHIQGTPKVQRTDGLTEGRNGPNTRPETSSTKRELARVRCTEVRLYTFRINNDIPRTLALLNSPLLSLKRRS